MNIDILHLHECSEAKGLCVVIDVLRAFTTAAYAFAAGAEEITLVSSPEEAIGLHHEDRSLLLMGEVKGRRIPGFHFGNSPADIRKAPLSGRRLVQRTSAGTQGVINCRHADQMMITSFVVADATLKQIIKFSPSQVSFIVTGTQNGDEDLALAEYMKAKLLQHEVSPHSYLDRVRNSPEGVFFTNSTMPEFSPEDLHLALQIDRFSFAMNVEKRQGHLVARRLM